ncbi:MAG: hypothetical protein QXZ09_08235 [Candidatus Methanomethylicaceae archaeon]
MVEKIHKLIDIFVELQNPDVRDADGRRLPPKQHAIWAHQKRLEAAEIAKELVSEVFGRVIK